MATTIPSRGRPVIPARLATGAMAARTGAVVKATVKHGLLACLQGLGGLWLARRLNRDRLLILTYHGVTPGGGDPYLSRNFVDVHEFARQMAYLAQRCRCLRLSDAVERLAGGTLPPYAASVTFDDGFRNNFRQAFPILKRYGIPSTIFLATGHVGGGTRLLWTEKVGLAIARASRPTIVLPTGNGDLRVELGSGGTREAAARRVLGALKTVPVATRERLVRDLEAQLDAGGPIPVDRERYEFLEWDDVRAMAASGVEFGSHTVSHPILSTLGDEDLAREIGESKAEIERQLGAPCTLFAYPNGSPGDFDEREKQCLKRAGYAAAVTQIAGTNTVCDDLFALKRVNVGRGHRGLMFRAQVSGIWPVIRRMWYGRAYR